MPQGNKMVSNDLKKYGRSTINSKQISAGL